MLLGVVVSKGCRQVHDADVGRGRIRAKAFGDLKPQHVRHFHVENDEIGLLHPRDSDRLAPRIRLEDFVALGPEHPHHLVPCAGVVIDDEDPSAPVRGKSERDGARPGRRPWNGAHVFSPAASRAPRIFAWAASRETLSFGTIATAPWSRARSLSFSNFEV